MISTASGVCFSGSFSPKKIEPLIKDFLLNTKKTVKISEKISVEVEA